MRFSSGLKRAMDEWGYEVDAEAERLIKRGVPPWRAVELARDNVSRRRAQAATARDIERGTSGCEIHDPI